MLCDICKVKQATIEYNDIDGKTLHLCTECAQKKGLMSTSTIGFSMSDLLVNNASSEDLERDSKLRCKSCGLSYLEFRRNGRLGCPTCYEVFRERLIPLMRRIHGNVQHVGKIALRDPERLRTKQEIRDLQKELRKAVDREAFERAAQIRDQIKEMEAILEGISPTLKKRDDVTDL